MNCPKCGYEMGRNRRYCEQCGADTAVAMRLYRLSNRYYNEGLARAQVRDLSGAVLMLKKSLENNKRNIEARHLLGLVYYEMGEPVVALSEWIISKHFSPENNQADYFINKVQSNPVKLDAVNQTVKKYNQALAYAKQGSDDLAMLQLRKAISINPGYIRALQLLALLYMKNGEYEKAKRCLVRAQKTDVANTTTLLYLAEIERLLSPDGQAVHTERKVEGVSYQPAVSNVTYHEDKPNYIAFITFFAGILIGIAVLYWLVVPTVRSDVKTKYAAQERDYGAEIASYTTQLSVLKSEKEDLAAKLNEAKNQLAQLQNEMDSAPVTEFDTAGYEQAVLVLMEYPELEEKVAAAEKKKKPYDVLDELVAYGERLLACENGASLRTKTAELYNEIYAEVSVRVQEYGYDYGHDLYNDKEYEEAIQYLLAAYRMGGTDADTLYFLGRSYQRSGDEENAREYFQILVRQYPDSERADMAHQCMDGLE